LEGVPETPESNERLRATEIIASVCLATDLGMGFPLEHGFHATLMANRLCEIVGVDSDTTKQIFFASMLMYSGCTSEAALGKQFLSGDRPKTLIPYLFGGAAERATGFLRTLPPPETTGIQRTIQTARRLPTLIANSREQQAAICEVAETLSRRLGLPPEIHGLFTFITERWDGTSVLRRAKGNDIPLAIRIVVLCRDFAFQRHFGGDEHAIEAARARSGGAFDPELSEALVDHARELFTAVDDAGGSSRDAILDIEPKPWNLLEGPEIDRALAAIGDFADLVCPDLSGHSANLSDLASRAGRVAGMGAEETRDLRRAALVHDVGRVAVSPGIWEKTSPLNRDEQEKVRLHPYHTERVLSEAAFFKQILDIARNHHERLDGSGYHRGVDAPSLSTQARLLAAADTFQAMTEPRPHRPAMSLSAAAAELARLADTGAIDHAMASAVIEAAGEDVPQMERPGGLTAREAEVIGLLARGLQTKQIATALDISPKTADTHIQAAYRKMGVSTRAAATLYAMEHGMVASGELPIHT
jgi:HD-GYP domain-containing protein (c-di-GMP phosphodiesterase class II)